jgi:hypothetical protein
LGQGLLQLGVHALAALLIAIESSATDPELLHAMLASCAEAHGEGSCVAADAAATDEPVKWHARVIWEDGEGLRARIEIRRGASARRAEYVRVVSFAASDEPAQRHRAVGLIVASFVAERERERDEAPAPGTVGATKPTPTPPTERAQEEETESDTDEEDEDEEGDDEDEEDEDDDEPSPPAAPGSATLRVGVDVGLLVGTAASGGPPRLGLMLRGFLGPARYPLAATLAVRAAQADASRGERETALTALGGSAGGLLQIAASPEGALALELRLEAVVEHVQARALDPSTQETQSEGRFRLGAQLGVQGHAALGGGFGMFAGADGQLLLPAVSVEVGGRSLGRLPALGLTGLLGLRWSR